MANQQHLDILKRGVAEWNRWRAANPEVEPNLGEANLHAAQLHRAHLGAAYLSGACLAGAQLTEAHLDRAQLWMANLIGANLTGANLQGADLTGADLTGADLWGADLSGADLGEADLIMANLHEANLRAANLMQANLSAANLTRADLREADLTRASVDLTIFGDTDLSGVKGLETVQHSFPSTIGIDTLYRSGGKIPAAFLRGCGVPDTFIEYLPSLIGAQDVIQYYSCFISYSSKDEDFARRLHSRMRDEHLRVWFAPEDIKGGDKLYDQIDRAIQLHDRLLLVLSEQSMRSEWVMTEIRRARHVERKENRRKLFPIRLCSYDTLHDWRCFDAASGQDLADEVRAYFIPDFSTWKEHDAFESAFARLLRDLRAAEAPAPAAR